MRNDTWKEDEALEVTLRQYVRNRCSLGTILKYMERDFDEYAWSQATLKRRLSHFSIGYIDNTVTDLQVAAAVAGEIHGAGADLGYQTMTQKIGVKQGLKVPKQKVLEIMYEVDMQGIERGYSGEEEEKCYSRGSIYITSKCYTFWVC